jgi:hypothetical protein
VRVGRLIVLRSVCTGTVGWRRRDEQQTRDDHGKPGYDLDVKHEVANGDVDGEASRPDQRATHPRWAFRHDG